ncbi:uncharacterized protein LOC143030870 [Oratosquilla oratoria]|uniref:uncharacterized protein LOC143030870 n=1 Tax=Oratosquilla oratoria TaxID=337810 RepID=UPI003F76BB25
MVFMPLFSGYLPCKGEKAFGIRMYVYTLYLPNSHPSCGSLYSTSQIPSHREVCLYQQNLRPELDDLEKRYSTSSSTDPEHRVLQSNPMDDCNVTIQHLLGWIAAYQEEMKLTDRQGSVNMVGNDSFILLIYFCV